MSDMEDAVTHLQAAAREMVAAARAVLDITDELIDNPAPLLAALAGMAAAGRAAVQHERDTDTPGAADDDNREAAPTPPQRPRVQRIRVS
jgi:hypothetical protein